MEYGNKSMYSNSLNKEIFEVRLLVSFLSIFNNNASIFVKAYFMNQTVPACRRFAAIQHWLRLFR